MKKSLLAILLPVSVALFGGPFGGPSICEAAPKNSASNAAYDLGVQRGSGDAKNGLSRTPSRHEGAFPSTSAAAFANGYEAGYRSGIQPGSSSPVKDAPDGQRLTARNGAGKVTIQKGAAVVTTLKTASHNVEETRFINKQRQIVVKSRGNHGPATVQLFNARTGAEEGRVMAFEIQDGKPAWAEGMSDDAPKGEEKPATGPVPEKVIADCLASLRKLVGGKAMKVLSARRSEAGFIIDVKVDGAQKPWRCFHDGNKCTGICG